LMLLLLLLLLLLPLFTRLRGCRGGDGDGGNAGFGGPPHLGITRRTCGRLSSAACGVCGPGPSHLGIGGFISSLSTFAGGVDSVVPVGSDIAVVADASGSCFDAGDRLFSSMAALDCEDRRAESVNENDSGGGRYSACSGIRDCRRHPAFRACSVAGAAGPSLTSSPSCTPSVDGRREISGPSGRKMLCRRSRGSNVSRLDLCC